MQALIHAALKAYMLKVNFANAAEQTDEQWTTINQNNFVSLMTNKFGVRPVYVPSSWTEVHASLAADPDWQEIVGKVSDEVMGEALEETLNPEPEPEPEPEPKATVKPEPEPEQEPKATVKSEQDKVQEEVAVDKTVAAEAVVLQQEEPDDSDEDDSDEDEDEDEEEKE